MTLDRILGICCLPIALLIAASAVFLAGDRLSAGPPPKPLDIKAVEAEVKAHYNGAHPEIKEYILWTAKTFGRGGLWLSEDALADLPDGEREERVQHLATLFSEAEYGRHLCEALAQASALKDERLVPGLIKIADFHQPDRDYDCRPKWIAIAALARQESDQAVPVLISLVDHGNQNTRFWARAALARKTGQDFKQDKQAWAKWWQEQGHDPIDPERLKPYEAPKTAAPATE
jgi:hypothetical protein